MATVARERGANAHRITAGVIGGLAGGLAFGLLMAMMGMLPMVAGLVGSDSAGVGLLVHLILSAAIGAGFGLAFGGRLRTPGESIAWGLLYGAIWWVLGPLLLMPLLMGMGLQFAAAFSGPMLTSLLGHLIYGAITGVVAFWYTHR